MRPRRGERGFEAVACRVYGRPGATAEEDRLVHASPNCAGSARRTPSPAQSAMRISTHHAAVRVRTMARATSGSPTTHQGKAAFVQAQRIAGSGLSGPTGSTQSPASRTAIRGEISRPTSKTRAASARRMRSANGPQTTVSRSIAPIRLADRGQRVASCRGAVAGPYWLRPPVLLQS